MVISRLAELAGGAFVKPQRSGRYRISLIQAFLNYSSSAILETRNHRYRDPTYRQYFVLDHGCRTIGSEMPTFIDSSLQCGI